MRGQRKRNASAAGFVKNFVAVSQLTIHGNFPRLRSARALVRTPVFVFAASLSLFIPFVCLSVLPSIHPLVGSFVRRPRFALSLDSTAKIFRASNDKVLRPVYQQPLDFSASAHRARRRNRPRNWRYGLARIGFKREETRGKINPMLPWSFTSPFIRPS